MTYCPECGEELSETAEFCNSCGAALSQDAGESGGTAPQATEQEGGGLLQDRKAGYDFAIYYPKERGWKPVLISAVLLVGSIVIVPLLALLGYSYRTGRAAATGTPEPPAYGDWGGLVVDGIRWFVVALIPALLWVIPLGIAGAISPVLGIVASLATYWFVGAFLTAFIGTTSVKEALTDGRAWSLLKSEYYLKAWLGFVLFIVGMWILTMFSALLILGPLFMTGYLIVAIGAYWGYVHYQAVQKGIIPRAVSVGDAGGHAEEQPPSAGGPEPVEP